MNSAVPAQRFGAARLKRKAAIQRPVAFACWIPGAGVPGPTCTAFRVRSVRPLVAGRTMPSISVPKTDTATAAVIGRGSRSAASFCGRGGQPRTRPRRPPATPPNSVFRQRAEVHRLDDPQVVSRGDRGIDHRHDDQPVRGRCGGRAGPGRTCRRSRSSAGRPIRLKQQTAIASPSAGCRRPWPARSSKVSAVVAGTDGRCGRRWPAPAASLRSGQSPRARSRGQQHQHAERAGVHDAVGGEVEQHAGERLGLDRHDLLRRGAAWASSCGA